MLDSKSFRKMVSRKTLMTFFRYFLKWVKRQKKIETTREKISLSFDTLYLRRPSHRWFLMIQINSFLARKLGFGFSRMAKMSSSPMICARIT